VTTVTTTRFVSLLASEVSRERLGAHARAGGAFAYPTATVYGLGSTVAQDSVRRLTALKQRPPSKSFLVVSGRATTFEALDWHPQARRLAEAFWPGRLTLVLKDSAQVFGPVLRGSTGGVAVRHSAHPAVSVVEWAIGSALTSTSANPPGEPPAMDAAQAEQALKALGCDHAWVVDGGRLGPSPSSTIVDCTDERPRVVRVGTFSLQEVERVLSGDVADLEIGAPQPFSILFVCTGNTCRSPLAEVIAVRRLAELEWQARANSAGVFAAPGSAASADSCAVAAGHGLSLERHRSRQLDEAVVLEADLILTMSEGHLEAVQALGAGGKAALLGAFAQGSEDPFDGPGVIDPIGSGREMYEATYENLVELIHQALERLAPVMA